MKAQDIIPQYGTVVAEFDVDKLLCDYVDADVVVSGILSCIKQHTSAKWAMGVKFSVKEIVDRVVDSDPEMCSRTEKYCFVSDDEYFLGYDPKQGIVLRRRA